MSKMTTINGATLYQYLSNEDGLVKIGGEARTESDLSDALSSVDQSAIIEEEHANRVRP